MSGYKVTKFKVGDEYHWHGNSRVIYRCEVSTSEKVIFVSLVTARRHSYSVKQAHKNWRSATPIKKLKVKMTYWR